MGYDVHADRLFVHTTEVGLWLSDVTPGTAAAGKALVLDATGAIDTLGTVTSQTIGTLTLTEPLAMQSGINRQGYIDYFEDFFMSTGGSNPAPWVEDLQTSSTGAEMPDEPGGVYQLATVTNDAADAAQLTWGDQLLIAIGNNAIIEFRIRVDGVADLTSVEKIIFGVCQNHANAEDNAGLDDMDHSAWFMLKSTDLVIYTESDDGTTDTDDAPSSETIIDDTWTLLKIDFSDMGAVVFSVNGVFAASHNMGVSATENVQPIICIQRTDGTQTEAAIGVEIDYVQIRQDR